MATEQSNPLAQLAAAVADEDQDPDLILEHANAALELPEGPQTQEVQLCRLVALVNNSEYAEVISSLKVLECPLSSCTHAPEESLNESLSIANACSHLLFHLSPPSLS